MLHLGENRIFCPSEIESVMQVGKSPTGMKYYRIFLALAMGELME
jgi:hypothetical protein